MEAETDYKTSGFVDEKRAVGVIYLNFSKVFNTVSPNVLLSKLGCCSVDNWTSWVKKPGWMVRVRVLWGMGHTLPGGWYHVEFCRSLSCLTALINVLEEEVEYVLFNADYHKLGDAVNTFEGRADIQRDLDWLEE